MAVTCLDHEIEPLVQEEKPVLADWSTRIRLVPKRGHNERHLDIAGAAGSEFRLILRQNRINQLDFPIILAVRVPRSNQMFRLRRCNGRSHEHTNRIESVTIHDFHIHFATERYQEVGAREDAYAEPTGHFGDFCGALQCLSEDANLKLPSDRQGELFQEW